MVSRPLTLVMAIKSQDDYGELVRLLNDLQSRSQEENPIVRALVELSTVHFARFVFLGTSHLMVITTYDGSFEDYIDAFVNKIGQVFDLLLTHMHDAPPLPTSKHREQFLQYVQANDLPCVGEMFSAYPQLTVLDILTLERGE